MEGEMMKVEEEKWQQQRPARREAAPPPVRLGLLPSCGADWREEYRRQPAVALAAEMKSPLLKCK